MKKSSAEGEYSLGLLGQETRFLTGNTFPDENLSARHAARRYLSVCVSRRVMHFFSMCILYIDIHIYIHLYIRYVHRNTYMYTAENSIYRSSN